MTVASTGTRSRELHASSEDLPPGTLDEWLLRLAQQGEIGRLLRTPEAEQEQRGYLHTLREICQQPVTWIDTAGTTAARASVAQAALDAAEVLAGDRQERPGRTRRLASPGALAWRRAAADRDRRGHADRRQGDAASRREGRIGRAAAQMIGGGETVMLDSGTTTLEVARQIKLRKLDSLTVITNALNIAMEFVNLPSAPVIMLGGMLRGMSYSLVGPHAEQALRSLQSDRLFLGVDGLDPEIGLMTPDPLEAQLCGGMIEASREVVVVADSSKFERRSLSVIAKLDAVDKVITDSGVSPSWVAALRAQSVDVEVV